MRDALERLLRIAVLVSVANDRYVAFRHDILFDCIASHLYPDPYDSIALRNLLARDRGLLVAPALGYALQELWSRADATRADYWATLADCIPDPDADPIARRVAARSACELTPTPGDRRRCGSMRSISTPAAPASAIAWCSGWPAPHRSVPSVARVGSPKEARCCRGRSR